MVASNKYPLRFRYDFILTFQNPVNKNVRLDFYYPENFYLDEDDKAFTCSRTYCSDEEWILYLNPEPVSYAGGQKRLLQICDLFDKYIPGGKEFRFSIEGWSHLVLETCDSFNI